MTTVSELAGQLAARARYCARTAVWPQQLEPLARTYDQHVSWLANAPVRGCGHADGPPYIIVAGAEDRAWCIECVKEILRNDSPPCGNCVTRGTEVFMFPFGDIIAAGNICPECGGEALTTGPT